MSKDLILTPNAYNTGKVYAIKPVNGTGDFDFARNTGRTRINVNGQIEELSNNIVALDYQNNCPEILLEPQRTNLLPYSNNFDINWDRFTRVTKLGLVTAPDATNSALEIKTDDTSNAKFVKNENTNTVAGRKYVASAYFRSDNPENITDGKLLRTDINPTPLSATLITSQWQRISQVVEPEGDGFALFTNLDNNSVIQVWGAVLEEKEKPTSYIPTNGSTVTRNQDTLSKNLTPIIDSTYTMLLEVNADDSRLQISDNLAGIDLPLTGKGKIAIQVDTDIKIIFPDNGQPQTKLAYEKPNDFRNLEFISKLAATRIGVIAIENGIQDISSWINGDISSYFIETDWGLETSLDLRFTRKDFKYIPFIDISNTTNFNSAWGYNNIISFPFLNVSSGTNFKSAWYANNIILFPSLDLSSGTNFQYTWRYCTSLRSFPANMFDSNIASNYYKAFEFCDLDQQSVDNILISINTSSQANNINSGNLGVQGGTNATPSQAGKDAADALFAKGWTVILNGYTPS